ncbi:MAG TPA: thioredoxin domain-containing protein [Gaiellaceae bacterium]|nr:thioredoxin domain-containing protein [Gaiellaceae bacterium]
MKNVVLVAVLVVAAGLAAALIAVSALGGDEEPATSGLHGAATTEQLLAGIPQNGNVLGRADAPVTVVEYADFQCPFCAQWAVDTFPAIVDEYVRPGKAKIVFQGLAFIGPDSATALEMAASAASQDRLWNVAELLFHNQGAENSGWVTDELLEQIGSSVKGLDGEAMLEGRGSAEVAEAVSSAQEAAAAAGVSTTPTFEIGRIGGPMTQVQGARPTGDFRQLLDGLLAGE